MFWKTQQELKNKERYKSAHKKTDDRGQICNRNIPGGCWIRHSFLTAPCLEINTDPPEDNERSLIHVVLHKILKENKLAFCYLCFSAENLA